MPGACLAWPPSCSDRHKAGASPELRCAASPTCKVRAPVFKEEEGDGGDYNLYGTEHCLPVSLFNEKQNNPSSTQHNFMSSVGEESIS